MMTCLSISRRFLKSSHLKNLEKMRKDETDQDEAGKKKVASDSDEEELDNQQKEKGVSNKKKENKIAELKQTCRKPDIWDATAQDPRLLVFLKSHRNTVHVRRHWCQKRKYLQGSGFDIHRGVTGFCQKGPLIGFS